MGMHAVQLLSAGFTDANAPYQGCHASTIAETGHGLCAAWFAGTDEGKNDVGIWFAQQRDGAWRAPREIAIGHDDTGARSPCWNPVLVVSPDEVLHLFHKVGPSPRAWWGMHMLSRDEGATWSAPTRLSDGLLGPIKNKPLVLPDGGLLCGSSTEHAGWVVHVEVLRVSPDGVVSGWRTPVLHTSEVWAVIQPTLLRRPDGRVLMLCRSKQGVVTQCWSADDGATWGPMTATGLPNPNSGIDAVVLADGRALLIYNPAAADGARGVLSAALSDDWVNWTPVLQIDGGPREYSYPAVIQARDGRVHVTYTWRRERIKHVMLQV